MGNNNLEKLKALLQERQGLIAKKQRMENENQAILAKWGDLEEVIDMNYKLRNTYFWTPPQVARLRRAMEDRYYAKTEFTFRGEEYSFEVYVSCSCRHVYTVRNFSHGSIRALKKVMREIEEEKDIKKIEKKIDAIEEKIDKIKTKIDDYDVENAGLEGCYIAENEDEMEAIFHISDPNNPISKWWNEIVWTGKEDYYVAQREDGKYAIFYIDKPNKPMSGWWGQISWIGKKDYYIAEREDDKRAIFHISNPDKPVSKWWEHDIELLPEQACYLVERPDNIALFHASNPDEPIVLMEERLEDKEIEKIVDKYMHKYWERQNIGKKEGEWEPIQIQKNIEVEDESSYDYVCY